jgi:rhodanese-related sulfurtransferase
MQELSPDSLAAWLADATRPAPQLLDVREDWEVATCAIKGSIAIPMGQITERTNELDPERPVVCYCHHGMRSLQVGLFLEHQGFGQVLNLDGGIDAWARTVDPSCPTY